uniref:Uncharacterized protein n=1 Tax=Anguilla anguilla TaxID=7936 RepID=A0A0E9TVD2_ANGAN
MFTWHPALVLGIVSILE